VLSPISPAAVLRGTAAACGILAAHEAPILAALSRRFAARHVLLTDSGTSALVLALRIAASRGATVAFPSYACVDLLAAARYAGVGVRLYDVQPETLGPDLVSLRAALRRGANVVVVAPLYGYPVDMPALLDLAAEHGVPVIEDAAQGAGGTLGGQRTGTTGAMAIVSFGRGKGTTGGSGGALLARSDAFGERLDAARATLRPRARGFADMVKLSAQWILARPALYGIPSAVPALRLGEMVYHPADEPAAIAAAALRVLPSALAADDAVIAARRVRAAELTASVSAGRRFRAVLPIAGAEPGYLRLAVLDQALGGPAPRFGVLRGYPIALDEHPVAREVLLPGESAGAGARTLRDQLLTAPTHSRMSVREVQHLRRWLAGSSESRDADAPPRHAA
jgi:hypothetical protein